MEIAGTTTDEFYLGVGSKATIFASTTYLLPFQDVTIKRRILITVVEDGEEEKEHDHVNQLAAEDLAEITHWKEEITRYST
jgi:hypothetical protein